MAKLKSMFNRLVSLVDGLTTGPADLKVALLRKIYSGSADLQAADGTREITVCMVTPAACKILSCNLVPETTVTATANSRDYSLWHDDGAGGTPVELTTDIDGTAVAMTTAVLNSMTVTAGLEVPAGSRLYVESTKNSSGGVTNDIQVAVEVEFIDD